MISPSLVCDPSKLAEFLPASVVNVALAFSIIAMQPAWNNYFPTGQISPFTYVINAIGDLFPSKPKEILAQLSPTPTIKGSHTPTLQHQPESTSSILYAVAFCILLILFGAVFAVLRNNTANPPFPSVNVPRFTSQPCDNGSPVDGDITQYFPVDSNDTSAAPGDDPVDPFHCGANSDSKLTGNNFSKLVGEIGGSPPPPPPPSHTTSGMDDDAHKKTPRFLAKLKMFLIIFTILTTLTHAGRITRKIQSLAIHGDSTYNASVTPYFRWASELVTTNDSLVAFTQENTLATEIVHVQKLIIVPSASVLVKYNKVPSSGSPSASDFNDDSASLPLPTKDFMLSIPTPAHPVSFPFMAVRLSTPTIPSPSKVTLALEYIKLFTLFFVFCILVPILSFAMTILPTVIQLVQLSKSKSADVGQETFTHAGDDGVIKFNVGANEVVRAIEVVKNSKVGTNIIHDEVVPVSTSMDKGKGNAPQAIEETCSYLSVSSVSDENHDPTTPTLSTDTPAVKPPRRERPRPPRQPCRVRKENKRIRKAEAAAIEAALNAPFI